MGRLDADNGGIRFGFTADSPIDIGKLLARVQRESNRFRLSPDGNLTLLKSWDSERAGLQAACDFIDELIAA